MEKIKITQKELDEMYDVEKVVEKEKDETANATFEVFTENYDKKQQKEMLEDG